MRALPSCEVLEVGELLVPMVGDAVVSIDVDERRIVVDPEFLGVESDPARRGRRLAVRLDVVTLFPDWFDWFTRSATSPTRWPPATSCARWTCASTRR